MKLEIFYRCFLLLLISCGSLKGQVNIIESQPGVTFTDIGYNAASGETTIVARIGAFSDGNFSIATLNSANDGFVFTKPANVAGAVNDFVIAGISNDGSRLAGYVKNAAGLSEPLTWATSDLSNVVEIGRPDGNLLVGHSALAAWSGGVVGSFTNYRGRWNAATGFELSFVGGTNRLVDVSDDGLVAVGQFGGSPGVWEEGEVTILIDATQFFGFADVEGVSPDGNSVGGFVSDFGGGPSGATIWEGPNWEIKYLLNENNQEFLGGVLGLTDNGYVIGVDNDDLASGSRYFIYHDSWQNVVYLNDWLTSLDPSLRFDGEVRASDVHWDAESDTLRLIANSFEDDRARLIVVDLSPEPDVLLGDVDQNDAVDFADIPHFIALLVDGAYQIEADVNEDGFVDISDIGPFIVVLSN